MGQITGAYVTPGKNREMHLSAFDERMHQGDTAVAAPWLHRLRSFKVKKGVSKAELQSAVASQLNRNNLDELVVSSNKGLHVVYGRGLARDIKPGDKFVSNELKGEIVAIDREARWHFLGLRLQAKALLTLGVATPFLAIPGASWISGLGSAWPLAGLGFMFAAMAGAMYIATRGVSDEADFSDAEGHFAADISGYTKLAARPREVVASLPAPKKS